MAIFFDDFNLKIGKEEITEYISLSLSQEMLAHHVLSVIVRRDHFENPLQPIFKVTQNLIGESLKLSIQSPDKQKLEFIGIVQEIRTSRSESSSGDIIQITASSPDVVLSDVGHYSSFEAKALNDVVENVLGKYPLNTKINIAASPNKNIHYVTQYNENAFSFLSRLAIRYGQWFLYDGTTLHFGSLPQKITHLEYKKDLFKFEFSLKLNSFMYDFVAHDFIGNKYNEINSVQANRRVPKISDAAFQKSDKVYKHQAYHYYQGSHKDSGRYNELSDEMQLSKAAAISNLMVCTGSTDNPALTLGSMIEVVENVEKDGNKQKLQHGKFIITGLNHHCDRNGNYRNDFTALPSDIESPPYTNPELFAYAEPHCALVTDNSDPDALGRVRVQFFWQKKDNLQTPWIRLASPHGGKDKGFHFIPEVGEEVIIGFEGGNSDKPYVLGTLYHGIDKPLKGWQSNDNDYKAIRTRSGHTVEFIDKSGKEEVHIYDGSKDNYTYSIILASHSKKILIETKGDMEIKADNIRITANKDFELKATDIKQSASSSVELKATSKMSLDGGAQMEQKASAKMTINGGGLLEQKAGIIKMN